MTDKIIIDIHPWVGENKVWQPHLIASEILKHVDKEIVLSINDEGFDISKNGLEEIVKTICDYNKIPYSQISFMSGNTLYNSKFFNHVYIGYNGDAARLNINEEWYPPTDSKYGLFLVRPTNERFYTFHNHMFWKNFEKGKSTFHFSPNTIDLNNATFSNFLIEHNSKWQYIKEILPYSDYEKYDSRPSFIAGDTNNRNFWNNVYNECQIEIVCETNIRPKSYFITEKTLRPLLYGRLFVIVGSPRFENHLKSLGFDIFDDIIDKSYDLHYSYNRVDNLFLSLDKFLSSNFNLLTIKERLLNNQKKVNDFILNHYQTKISKLSK